MEGQKPTTPNDYNSGVILEDAIDAGIYEWIDDALEDETRSVLTIKLIVKDNKATANYGIVGVGKDLIGAVKECILDASPRNITGAVLLCAANEAFAEMGFVNTPSPKQNHDNNQ